MKVVLVNGSPKPNGCTYTGLSIIKEQLAKQGVDSEIFQVGAKPIIGCTACVKCRTLGKCVFDDDGVNRVAEAMATADGLVLGSPVHYAGASGALTSFADRLFYSMDKKNLRLKFGASIVSCRRGGATAAFDQLNKYFTISQMPLVPSNYWNQIHGHTPEEVMKDEEGLQTLRVLANNMAYLIKCAAQSNVPLPEEEPKITTNFIR
ncbi:FMN reductase [Clostridia bacterium]|nr:FMN reductase [Clostridia bacterium]GHU74737.1 FMN reductase [Clostridia bacterium]